MAYMCKLIISPLSVRQDGTASDVHETAVEDYLDAQTISNLYVTTVIAHGYIITTIIFN